jgi:hypothetical protein
VTSVRNPESHRGRGKLRSGCGRAAPQDTGDDTSDQRSLASNLLCSFSFAASPIVPVSDIAPALAGTSRFCEHQIESIL